jgi:hypothetical protein
VVLLVTGLQTGGLSAAYRNVSPAALTARPWPFNLCRRNAGGGVRPAARAAHGMIGAVTPDAKG